MGVYLHLGISKVLNSYFNIDCWKKTWVKEKELVKVGEKERETERAKEEIGKVVSAVAAISHQNVSLVVAYHHSGTISSQKELAMTMLSNTSDFLISLEEVEYSQQQPKRSCV